MCIALFETGIYNLLFKMKYLLAGVALKIEAHCDMISTLVRKAAYVSACCAARGGVRGIPGAEDTGGWWTLHPHQLHRGPLTEHYTYYLVFVLRWVRGSILELSTNKLRIY